MKTPAQALYEYVAFRQRGQDFLPWDDAPAHVQAEYEQVVEVVLAAHEGRKPRLRPLATGVAA